MAAVSTIAMTAARPRDHVAATGRLVEQSPSRGEARSPWAGLTNAMVSKRRPLTNAQVSHQRTMRVHRVFASGPQRVEGS